MAVQIYDRIYNKSDEGGYDAVIADITTWFPWDEIDTETTANSCYFRKYTDDTHTKYVQIAANRNNGYSPRITAGAYNGLSVISSAMATDITYCTAAVTEKGFAVMYAQKPFTTANLAFSCFGICPGTNALTGETAPCVFFFGDSGVVLCADSVDANTTTLSTVKASMGLTLAVPLCARSSNFVPDDLQKLLIIPDNELTVRQSVTFNGKNFCRLGCLLIPE